MNTSTAQLEERIADLEIKINDTPEARAAARAEAEEATYLARLDRSLTRIRKDIGRGLAAHLRSRLKAEVEQAERQLAILRRENRTHQHQQATDALGRLPRALATEVLSPKFPEPAVYWMNHDTTDAVEAAKARKAHLEQYRTDYLEQAVSEVLAAIEAT